MDAKTIVKALLPTDITSMRAAGDTPISWGKANRLETLGVIDSSGQLTSLGLEVHSLLEDPRQNIASLEADIVAISRRLEAARELLCAIKDYRDVNAPC